LANSIAPLQYGQDVSPVFVIVFAQQMAHSDVAVNGVAGNDSGVGTIVAPGISEPAPSPHGA
jgi:hypothetical protein